jgi:hypothetical protein
MIDISDFVRSIAVKLHLFLILFFISGCNSKERSNPSAVDKDDYQIYAVVIKSCAQLPEDSTKDKDSLRPLITFSKGPVKRLLLIDSSRLVPAGKIIELSTMTDDSSLVNHFAKMNQSRKPIQTEIEVPVSFRKFSGQTFNNFLKLNSDNGFMEVYKKYPGISGVLEFSNIGYNAAHDKALVEICYYRTPTSSWGVFYLFEFRQGNWVITKSRKDWMNC